jgi:glutathione S-transferase
MSGEYVLGYWDIRGLAAPIRMAFSLAGIKYRDELYSVHKDGDKWTSNWGAQYKLLESTGATPFPNLPYLTLPDGKTTLVQSMAILRYVGRIGNIYGDSDLDMARIDEIIDQTMDLRNEMSRVCYSDFEGGKTTFTTASLPYYFSTFTKYLEQHKTQFMGTNKPSIGDLNCADAIMTAGKLFSDVTSKDFATEYPVLSEYAKRVFALPQLADYVAGPLNGQPANNKMAVWGSAPRRCDV